MVLCYLKHTVKDAGVEVCWIKLLCDLLSISHRDS